MENQIPITNWLKILELKLTFLPSLDYFSDHLGSPFHMGITETRVHDLLHKELPRVQSTYQRLKDRCENVAGDLRANILKIGHAKNDMNSLRGSTETAQDGLSLSDEFDEMKSAILTLKAACDSFSQKYNSKL